MGTRANFGPERECKKPLRSREEWGGVAKIPPRAKPARELAAPPQKVSRAHPLPPARHSKKFSFLVDEISEPGFTIKWLFLDTWKNSAQTEC